MFFNINMVQAVVHHTGVCVSYQHDANTGNVEAASVSVSCTVPGFLLLLHAMPLRNIYISWPCWRNYYEYNSKYEVNAVMYVYDTNIR